MERNNILDPAMLQSTQIYPWSFQLHQTSKNPFQKFFFAYTRLTFAMKNALHKF